MPRKPTPRTVKVVLLPVLGQSRILDLDNDLLALQKEVGGYLEALVVQPGLRILVDEDGKSKRHLLVNHAATRLLRKRGALGLPIVGPALLVRYGPSGQAVDVTEADLKLATAA
jgi:uncharacterized protein DUF3846